VPLATAIYQQRLETVFAASQRRKKWRVVVDARRTCQMLEATLLIKLYRKQSTDWQISLGAPFHKTFILL